MHNDIIGIKYQAGYLKRDKGKSIHHGCGSFYYRSIQEAEQVIHQINDIQISFDEDHNHWQSFVARFATSEKKSSKMVVVKGIPQMMTEQEFTKRLLWSPIYISFFRDFGQFADTNKAIYTFKCEKKARMVVIDLDGLRINDNILWAYQETEP